MYLKTTVIPVLSIMVFTASMAQTEESRKTRIQKRSVSEHISKTEQLVENTNMEIDSTSANIEQTVAQTKETIDKVGKIIFGSKEGNTKNKGFVVIEVHSVAYGNPALAQLQEQLKQLKGVKKVSKTYANDSATINVECKKTADEIWQDIPDSTKKSFAIESVTENTIAVVASH